MVRHDDNSGIKKSFLPINLSKCNVLLHFLKNLHVSAPPPQTLILPLKIGVNEFYGALQTRNIKAYRAAQMAHTKK